MGARNPLIGVQQLATLVHAADIANEHIFSLPPDMTSAEAVLHLDIRGYARAPVSGLPIMSYASVEMLRQDPGVSVGTLAQPIEEKHLLLADADLTQALVAIDEQEWLVVTDGDRATGFLTTDDIAHPAVTLYTLGLTLALERGVGTLIERHLPDWDDITPPPAWLTDAREIVADRRTIGVDQRLIDCVTIEHKLDLFTTDAFAAVWGAIGITSKTQREAWRERFSRLRNELAHNGTALDARSHVATPVEQILTLRDLTTSVWATIEDRQPLYDVYLATIITTRDGDRLAGPSPCALPADPCWAVTAENPQATHVPPHQNEQLTAQLRSYLHDNGLETIEVIGVSPGGEWSEAGFVLTDSDRATACAIGRRFDQLAIFELTDATTSVILCANDQDVAHHARDHTAAS